MKKIKIEKKKCSQCKKTKVIKHFYRDSSIKDGFKSYCKACGLKYKKNISW